MRPAVISLHHISSSLCTRARTSHGRVPRFSGLSTLSTASGLSNRMCPSERPFLPSDTTLISIMDPKRLKKLRNATASAPWRAYVRAHVPSINDEIFGDALRETSKSAVLEGAGAHDGSRVRALDQGFNVRSTFFRVHPHCRGRLQKRIIFGDCYRLRTNAPSVGFTRICTTHTCTTSTCTIRTPTFRHTHRPYHDLHTHTGRLNPKS